MSFYIAAPCAKTAADAIDKDINKICFTASSVEKQMHTYAVTKRGVRFDTAVSGTAERKTENYVPEMTAYSLSKSARLK